MSTVELEQQDLLIGGEWKGAGSGSSFEQTDPFTGDTVGKAAAAKREDAHAAADAAAAAFPEWAATPPNARRELLQKAAGLLRERAEHIAGIVTAGDRRHLRLGHVQHQLRGRHAATRRRRRPPPSPAR